MKQVFISYSRSERDQVLARAVARALESAGFSAWLDEEKLPPGEPLEEDLRSAIEQSDAGIFLVSNSWLERKWCRWEIQQFGLRPTPARLRAKLRTRGVRCPRRGGSEAGDPVAQRAEDRNPGRARSAEGLQGNGAAWCGGG